MQDDKNKIRGFIIELINNGYALSKENSLFVKTIFDSRIKHKGLVRIQDYYFKTTYLSRILSLEMDKTGLRVPMIAIKDRAKRNDIVVYYKRIFDKDSNKPANFFFIIDTLNFLAYGFKKFPGKNLSENKKENIEKNSVKTFNLKRKNNKYVEVPDYIDTQRVSLSLKLENNGKADLIEEMSRVEPHEINEDEYIFTFIALENIRICSNVDLVLGKNNHIQNKINVKITRVKKVSFDEVYEYTGLYKINKKEKKSLANIISYITKTVNSSEN